MTESRLYVQIKPEKDENNNFYPLEKARYFYIDILIISSSPEITQRLREVSRSHSVLSPLEYTLVCEDNSTLEKVKDYTVIKQEFDTTFSELSKDLKEDPYNHKDMETIKKDWSQEEIDFYNNQNCFMYREAITSSLTTQALARELSSFPSVLNINEINKVIEIVNILDIFWD